MAEGVGFEPTSRCRDTVFKTAAFDHSAIPPAEFKFLSFAAVKGQQLLTACRSLEIRVPSNSQRLSLMTAGPWLSCLLTGCAEEYRNPEIIQ